MSNVAINRMIEALVRDEMDMVRSMSMKDLDIYLEEMIRNNFEAMPERHIIEEYERLA